MNLTKRIILSAAAMLVFMVLCYASVSFIKVDTNPIVWSERVRALFAFISLGIGGCVFGFVMNATENL